MSVKPKELFADLVEDYPDLRPLPLQLNTVRFMNLWGPADMVCREVLIKIYRMLGFIFRQYFIEYVCEFFKSVGFC